MFQVILLILGTVVVPLIFKALAALGIGTVTYTGVQFILDQVTSLVQTHLFALPIEVQQLLGVLRLDDALSLVISAVAVRAVFAGLNASGAISRTRWKLPGSGA